ncbi:hypothetical protein SFRURICE_017725 [Spodoptera frugiperda]|nr:hypothetical protein SFRURICE_017725 [Spodoptera frugiperda]
MKTCAACNVQFSDGVQCGSCRKHLDFGCANISESGWRKLGTTRMAQWKCPTCRSSSPAMLTPEPASLETILSEIRDMKVQLQNLPTLVGDLRVIKEELAELKITWEGASGRLDDFDTRLAEVEAKASGLMSFLNRYVKEDFIAAARAVKDLSTSHIGFQGTSQRVYINDHLSVEYKKLLSRVKILAKEKCYEFVWVKHGKIHVLKNANSKVIIIRKETDLNKIV